MTLGGRLPVSTDNSSTTKKSDKKMVRDALLGLLPSSRWFIFCRDFCYVMKPEEAMFVQDLINRYDAADEEDIDNEGYFRCTVDYLDYPPMNWSEETQKRLFVALGPAAAKRSKKSAAANKGARDYLRKKLSKTTPPQRWVFVNVKKIMQDIADVKKEQGTTYKKRWKSED